jgi:Na+-translocating ferredoxin:NAD+ oxidoreductase RnfE subunit
MKIFIRFHKVYWMTIWHIRSLLLVFLAMIAVNAAVIAHVEKMSFANALYFAFVTGLTLGYGDIVVITVAGRVFAILTGFVGMLFSGLTIAVAVYALRKSVNDSQNPG